MQKARRRPTRGSDRLQTDGFRFCFTPLLGVLPTFPSRYWSTVGLPGVFSLAGWSPPVRTGFLVSRPTQVAALPAPVARTGVSPSSPRLSRRFRFLAQGLWRLLLPRDCLDSPGLGSCRFARHYYGNRCFLSFPAGTEMFQFPAFAHLIGVTGLQPAGLPHSDTHGSVPACGSPCFFAACRVLHRLRKPRHPPSALVSFALCDSPHSRAALVCLEIACPATTGLSAPSHGLIVSASLPRFLSHYCQ